MFFRVSGTYFQSSRNIVASLGISIAARPHIPQGICFCDLLISRGKPEDLVLMFNAVSLVVLPVALKRTV